MDLEPTDTRDASSTLLYSTIVLTLVGALFVSARLWVRFFSTKAHSWDDYFIIGSLAASLVSMALTIAMVHHGYGKSIKMLKPAQTAEALKFSNFAVLVNGFAMAFLKLSIGASLLRLQLGKGMVWIVWASIVISVVANGLVIVGTLFGCRHPLAAVWDRRLMSVAECLPPTVTMVNSYIQTVGNIVTDLFYSFGPLYFLSKVRVSVYNKWALRCVFMMGLLATVCAIAKCTELPKLKTSVNPTYDGTLITLWVRAELNAGLVAAAMPPLKSLFENILRNVFGVGSQMRSHTGYATRKSGTRRAHTRDPEDDEIAIRGHSGSYLHSTNRFQLHQMEHGTSADGESASSKFEEEQHGVVGVHERKNSRDGSGDYGKFSHGPITKTVSYTVSNDRSGQGS